MQILLKSLALFFAFVCAADAQTFPTKPVKIITPFPAGSGPEASLRLVAEKLSRMWGQPVVVENRPGGNGFIAIDAFKRGAADGHDLIQIDSVHVTAYPHLFKKLPYDAEKDFEPIVPLFKTYFFFAVSTESKYKTVGDLISDARANPGKLNYGSWSIGNPVHLGSALFESVTATSMVHVPYKETSLLYTDVATNALSFSLGTSATTRALYGAGKLRFLAIAAPGRNAAYPDVPTVGEAGGPDGFEVSGWTAIAAPRGLPAAITEKIQRDVEKVLAEQDIKERYRTFGYEMFPQTRGELAQFIRAESALQSELIKKAKVAIQ